MPRPTTIAAALLIVVFRSADAQPVYEPEMVEVPGGAFMMGAASDEFGRWRSEEPQHKVTVAPFMAGKYEVTFDKWDACVADGGCPANPTQDGMIWGRGRRPAINVSWEEAHAYVRWLGRKTGRPYRLLSEAEWEYAARAGTTTPFSTGRGLTSQMANVNGMHPYADGSVSSYRERTVEVGSFPPNAFGLYDMHGNVWEWVEDCWHGNYTGAPDNGSAWTERCRDNYHVLRGGSWGYGPGDARSASRQRYPAEFRAYDLGFRVALTATR